MPTNDYLAFATGIGANVESQASYAADSQLSIGNQPGVARSAFVNKTLRQAAFMAATLAQFMANTTGNNVLDDGNMSNLLATMALTWPGTNAPTVTKLTTTGTTTGWLFTCSTANATVGATYANNTNTYTVLATLASGTLLFCSGAAAPTGSGTLTKQSGVGDSTITFSLATALATYTTPVSAKYLKIKMAGGGGGACNQSNGGGQGTIGTLSAFGANLLVCFPGGPGVQNASPGTGGTTTLNSPALSVVAFDGGDGMAGESPGGNTHTGGAGGTNPFGGVGASSAGSNGSDGKANTGAGGTGSGASSANFSGAGGGAGGYIEAIIPTPAATYVYCIGTGGPGATAGSFTAGDGADGIISIEEHYGS